MEKYLIIGLGNPNNSYKYTRHNLGSFLIRLIILNNKIKKTFENKYGKIYILNNKYIFLLSKTYMNKIGISIKYFLKKYKLKIKNLIVISDDIYLNFGIIKVKQKGGSGGHKGLKNIELILKSNNYYRIKVGIGHNFKYGELNKYVLSNMNKKELSFIKNNLYNQIYNIILNK
ncbi:MAG: aminoacyl-tRNA hydrolase [Candidatus Shikimatogenerans bostrichidophilus]|nr:MAG: aminoacyl-tRNA hydrolase [Candidatus Shikimatogenerans bostrichidophilus]